MKILTGAQIRELDKYTIEHEPIASIDLMERSARAICNAICEQWTQSTPIVVFAGPGNNGGDALAMSRMLAEKGTWWMCSSSTYTTTYRRNAPKIATASSAKA